MPPWMQKRRCGTRPAVPAPAALAAFDVLSRDSCPKYSMTAGVMSFRGLSSLPGAQEGNTALGSLSRRGAGVSSSLQTWCSPGALAYNQGWGACGRGKGMASFPRSSYFWGPGVALCHTHAHECFPCPYTTLSPSHAVGTSVLWCLRFHLLPLPPPLKPNLK